VVEAGKSKLGYRIGNRVLASRQDRVAYLQEEAGTTVCVTRLGDLLPHPRQAVRKAIKDTQLILVTSQEIDVLCESGNVPLARRFMDEVLHELRRAFRALTSLGVQRIVFAADHGYLFGQALGSDMKIDAPGGHTADLHRRVWVGRGGEANPAFLRANISAFGFESDLELATPFGFAGFKVQGGATAYFHGGLSPQELIVPIGVLQPRSLGKAPMTSDIAWELHPGSPKITSKVYSVTIGGKATGLFRMIPPKVRVELRMGADVVSSPIGASYGYEESTHDVQLDVDDEKESQLLEDVVALLFTSSATTGLASLHLQNALSGVELARIEGIEISILD